MVAEQVGTDAGWEAVSGLSSIESRKVRERGLDMKLTDTAAFTQFSGEPVDSPMVDLESPIGVMNNIGFVGQSFNHAPGTAPLMGWDGSDDSLFRHPLSPTMAASETPQHRTPYFPRRVPIGSHCREVARFSGLVLSARIGCYIVITRIIHEFNIPSPNTERVMAQDTEAADEEQQAFRTDYPSGWLVLTRNESVPYIIDALLDLAGRREFNQTELAELAGVSRQSVARHLDLLLTTGVIEPVENTSPQRYRFDPESDVSRALIQLDGAMNAVGPQFQP